MRTFLRTHKGERKRSWEKSDFFFLSFWAYPTFLPTISSPRSAYGENQMVHWFGEIKGQSYPHVRQDDTCEETGCLAGVIISDRRRNRVECWGKQSM